MNTFTKKVGRLLWRLQFLRRKKNCAKSETFAQLFIRKTLDSGGSIGGPAAILAKENILSVEVVDFGELGMEAVRKITIKDFPAFIITDDKGNDFFSNL